MSVSSRATVYRVGAGVVLTITERKLKPAGGLFVGKNNSQV